MRQIFSIVLCLIAAGALAAEPAEKTFELAISGGQVAKDQRLIRVDKGTPVKLRVTSDTAGSPPASFAILRSVSRSIPEWGPPCGWLCHVPTNARYPTEFSCASRNFLTKPAVPSTNRPR